MAPSCAIKLQGMNITTENERIDRHRKTLISLYLSDHPENPREKEARHQISYWILLINIAFQMVGLI